MSARVCVACGDASDLVDDRPLCRDAIACNGREERLNAYGGWRQPHGASRVANEHPLEFDTEDPERPVDGICDRCERLRLGEVVIVRNCQITMLELALHEIATGVAGELADDFEDFAERLRERARRALEANRPSPPDEGEPMWVVRPETMADMPDMKPTRSA